MLSPEASDHEFKILVVIEPTSDQSTQVPRVRDGIGIPHRPYGSPFAHVRTTHQNGLMEQWFTCCN